MCGRFSHVVIMKTDKNSIAGNSAAALVAECEKQHRELQDEIARTIASSRNGGEVRMVLISGPSSSGKTTFAQHLCHALEARGVQPVQISMDDYFVNREDTPRDADGKYDFEAVEAVDLALLNDQLRRMLAGEEVVMPLFDFVEGRRRWQPEAVRPSADSVLVMEGLHALNPRLTSLVDERCKFKIFIAPLSTIVGDNGDTASPFDIRIVRRIARDNAHRGRTATETIEQWASVRRGEELYVFPFRDDADVQFDSSLRYELRVLRPLVEPLLASVAPDAPEYAEAQRLQKLLGAFSPIASGLVPRDSLLHEFIDR